MPTPHLKDIRVPSKEERIAAMKSYSALSATLENLNTANPEIEIEETEDKIVIPIQYLKLLAKILKVVGDGKAISILPFSAEMTTQAAAEYLGCSRTHLVKLLESDQIPFVKIGKHRRVKFEDLRKFKENTKEKRRNLLIEIMQSDEESGIYDS